jgi:hypothetical protein
MNSRYGLDEIRYFGLRDGECGLLILILNALFQSEIDNPTSEI